MANRRAALVGAFQGPWIGTKELRKPALSVTGGREGDLVRVYFHDGQKVFWELTISATETYLQIPAALWMRVQYIGKNPKGVIAVITSRKESTRAVSAA